MARIRTVKPEFWDSPSTAKAGPWARLAYIAMWNWADDFGRGTLNYKELEGFIFPNDSTFTDGSGNTVNFRSVVAEVSECFGVVLYEVDGRPYYAIPAWDKHQRNERRAKESKHPDPPPEPPVAREVADMHGISATPERKMQAVAGKCSLGTGEQGNRGTGEQFFSSDESDGGDEATSSEHRPEVLALLDHLDSCIVANGAKAPTRSKGNSDAARLLLDRDKRDEAQAHELIEWATSDDFWKSNILSMSKFRAKYDQLLLSSRRSQVRPPQAPSRNQRITAAFLADLHAKEGPPAIEPLILEGEIA